jgi:hypothetical protein
MSRLLLGIIEFGGSATTKLFMVDYTKNPLGFRRSA